MFIHGIIMDGLTTNYRRLLENNFLVCNFPIKRIYTHHFHSYIFLNDLKKSEVKSCDQLKHRFLYLLIQQGDVFIAGTTMNKRQHLKNKLKSMAKNQTITYPTSIEGPQIVINYTEQKKGWTVNVSGKKPFFSSNIEHVTDYLLILRPNSNWINEINQFRDDVKMEDIFADFHNNS